MAGDVPMILGTDHYWRDWTITDGDIFSPPDWSIAIANGVRFVWLKAADGVDKSHYFQEAFASAKAAGLLVGAYVWLDARGFADPKRQAENWHNVLKDLDCPASIDFEAYLDNVPDWHDLWDAAHYFKQLDPNRTIGMYSNYWYYMEHGNPDPAMKDLLTFNWAARYYSEPPQLYQPWMKTDIWQFSASGDPEKYGIANGKLAVDENWFYGTPEELAALFGAAIPPEPPGGDMYQGTVITQGLNVRNAPVTGAVVGSLALNDKVEADRVENGWWHLTKIRGVATVGEKWAYEGSTKGYIRTDAIVEPPTNETAVVTVTHEGKTGTATIELK